MGSINIIPHPHTSAEPCPGGCDDLLDMEKQLCESHEEMLEISRRIDQTHDEQTRLEARIDESGARMGRIEATLSTTNATLKTNTDETSEILGILKDAQSFFRFTKRAGEVIKWIFGLCTAALIFLYAVRDWPKH